MVFRSKEHREETTSEQGVEEALSSLDFAEVNDGKVAVVDENTGKKHKIDINVDLDTSD